MMIAERKPDGKFSLFAAQSRVGISADTAIDSARGAEQHSVVAILAASRHKPWLDKVWPWSLCAAIDAAKLPLSTLAGAMTRACGVPVLGRTLLDWCYVRSVPYGEWRDRLKAVFGFTEENLPTIANGGTSADRKVKNALKFMAHLRHGFLVEAPNSRDRPDFRDPTTLRDRLGQYKKLVEKSLPIFEWQQTDGTGNSLGRNSA